jgi:hypothetical protein
MGQSQDEERKKAEVSKSLQRKPRSSTTSEPSLADFDAGTMVRAKKGPCEVKVWANAQMYSLPFGVDLAVEITCDDKDQSPLVRDPLELSLFDASSKKCIRHRRIPSAFQKVEQEGSAAVWHMIIIDAFHSDLREDFRTSESVELPVGKYTISITIHFRSGDTVTVTGLPIEVVTRH